ncbi:MAG: TetR/AcrR family transcriptional regulator [Chitinophagales bacterium]|nr:TetR/AcrR family transcriptional regulator [Chitinophagales bacterium]
MAQTILTRKAQIKATAQNLFKEKGYSATSMRDLAKAVGIEPASLYSHISSKEEILSSICFRIAGEFNDALSSALTIGSNPIDALTNAIIAHTEVICRNLDAAAVFFNEWKHLPVHDLEVFKHKRHQYEEKFKQLLQEGMYADVFHISDINFTLRMLFASMNATYEWYKPNGKLTPKEIGLQIAHYALAGVNAINNKETSFTK